MQYLVTQFTFAFAAFIPIILGSRLILNLREAYYQPFTEELDRKTSTTRKVNLPPPREKGVVWQPIQGVVVTSSTSTSYS
jgi:hypothetical protein